MYFASSLEHFINEDDVVYALISTCIEYKLETRCGINISDYIDDDSGIDHYKSLWSDHTSASFN